MADASGGEDDLGIPGVGPAELVGRGGFGLVYRATQLGSGGLVAVKVLQDHLDESATLRFQREASALGALRGHPNICTVYDAGIDPGGRPYLIMEYAQSSLAQRVADGGALPWTEAVDLGVRMAGALETAHQAGLLHRDVKPENVLRTKFGEWRLADFGLVRQTDDTLSRSLTATVTHAAPELLEGAPASVASDLYALGSTLFVALTGGPAFVVGDQSHPVSIYRRIAEDPVPKMPGVPATVAEVVKTAMAKDPDARFPTATAMATALRQVQDGSAAAPSPVPVPLDVVGPGGDDTIDVRTPHRREDLTQTVHRSGREAPPPAEPQTPPAGGRNRRLLMAAYGVAAVVALVAGALALRGGDDDPGSTGAGGGPTSTVPGGTDEIRLPDEWLLSELVVDECVGAEGEPCPDSLFMVEECREPNELACSDVTGFEIYFSTDCPAVALPGGFGRSAGQEAPDACEISLLDLRPVPLEFNGEYGSAEVVGDFPSGGLGMEFVQCADSQVIHSLEFWVDDTEVRAGERIATRLTGRLFVYHPGEKSCASSYAFSYVMEASPS